MELIREKWNLIKETLRTEYDLSDISYNTWVKPLNFHSEKDDIVTIMIPSDQAHALKYISSKYKSYFQVTISEMMDHTYDIAFILEKDAENETSSSKAVYNINYINANLNSKYRFDTFVVGGNNKFAHSASLAVAESPGEAYNPLYLYGGAGLGKTHLMHSIGHFILDQNPDMKVLYVTSEQFTNEVIESIRSGNAAKMNRLREKYRTVDVLLIDDVQFIIGKESTQEEFFHTFNVLHSAGKQIILSSDKPPKEMETLEERFRSRFEWGLIADIQPPDYETRYAILKKNAENYNKEIKEEVFQYIATNIKSNIRELEGAYNKVIAFARLNKLDITLENVQEALKDIISSHSTRQITPQLIIDIVAEHFGISPEDIVSRKRNSEFVQPRQICMYLCRHLTEESLQSIGKALGKKDHTTVIHGIEKITEDIKTNAELKNRIDIIRKKISSE
ncbi:chromosomal replication initiator protein DnaA [Parablautia intestinalis]|jgi:chromosomal replication initiator protein DnaA|uniref:chromosomal replication initiator protein DnaA n=1 Tax=Parablautia intestinalis TaxID=2320100 RepID=UPI00259CCCCA|nr:chromosomal replication initiator protein DnaA [Parablautia intestinalis]MCI8615184.1 chromosomal replication initiator protein DnaA [Lachnospiraceae bacterium]